MNTKIIWIALFAIIALVSCDKDNEPNNTPETNDIVSITYNSYGGWGYFLQLSISSDSIHYRLLGNMHMLEQHEPIPRKTWENLVSKCDLSLFKKIKQGKEQAPVDGIDTKYIIQTKTEELSVLNGYGHEYEQMQDFFDAIEKIIQTYNEQFCDYVNTENINKTGVFIDDFLKSLTNDLNDEQKLEHLMAWLKSKPCIINAEILCVSCIKTFPAQSEIRISFIENGKEIEAVMGISMSDPLRFSGFHEIGHPDLLIGNWIPCKENYADGLYKYKRVYSLIDDAYGFSFQPGGLFIERKMIGRCGTPPVTYEDYKGTWTKNDSIIDVTVDFWRGTEIHQWKIISNDAEHLLVEVIKHETIYSTN